MNCALKKVVNGALKHSVENTICKCFFSKQAHEVDEIDERPDTCFYDCKLCDVTSIRAVDLNTHFFDTHVRKMMKVEQKVFDACETIIDYQQGDTCHCFYTAIENPKYDNEDWDSFPFLYNCNFCYRHHLTWDQVNVHFFEEHLKEFLFTVEKQENEIKELRQELSVLKDRLSCLESLNCERSSKRQRTK